MRGFSVITITLAVLLLVSISVAQVSPTNSVSQNAGSARYAASSASWGVKPLTVVNCVAATNGTIPIWTQSNPPNIVLCNSGIYEAAPYGTGAIGILNPNPIAALDVTGATNTSLYYQIGGAMVLGVGPPANYNLFVGRSAGTNNQAQYNTFVGATAGYNNTTGGYDTFAGASAGRTCRYCAHYHRAGARGGSQDEYSSGFSSRGKYFFRKYVVLGLALRCMPECCRLLLRSRGAGNRPQPPVFRVAGYDA